VFDVLVVGGGHAGSEAAAAAARMGASTCLLTHKLDTVGVMSCNPSIGGVGKGVLVREVDAMGGLMGRVADQAGIHFRMLNRSKGPAVWGPRAQMDRELYRTGLFSHLESQENLTIMAGAVEDLLLDEPAGGGAGSSDAPAQVRGVVLESGEEVASRCVVITTGTFLRGMIHMGEETFPAGRLGDDAATGLSATFERLGFPLGRLKTGTPPRLDGRTIDFSCMEEQPSDEEPRLFGHENEDALGNVPPHAARLVKCHGAYTNPRTHDVIRANLHRVAKYLEYNETGGLPGNDSVGGGTGPR
jgi:tRNA uridine 5-carboxymethylaminomethyl modification enzyme